MNVKRKKLLLALGSISFFLILFAIPASASWWDNSGGEDTVNFLTKYQDYLSYGNFLTVMFSTMGWLLIKGLFIVTNLLEGLISESITLLNFLNYTGLQGITGAIINDLVVALMVLTLVFLGFKTVIAKEPPNFKSVGVNIAFSAFLILGLPTLMSMMEDISVKFFDATQTGNNNEQISSLSWGLIQGNTTDLLYVSSRGFSLLDDSSNITNSMTPDSFKIANLNALITSDTVKDSDSDELKHLAYKLDLDENGETVADEIKGSAFGFLSSNFDEGYFRYESKFIPMFVGLFALMFAYLFTLFVFITTVIEIGIKQIVGYFVFATDLESGQRTKMVVQDILNAFMLIAFTGLSLKIYVVFLTFLATININPLIYTIAIVSATFVLIKGSNTIMRYFGVDVGVKEGFTQLAGAFALGRATAGGVKKMNDLANKGSNKPGSPMNEGRENLNGTGESFSSINSAPKGKGRAGIIGMGASVADSLKEKMPGKISPVQSNAGDIAMAGIAGATAGSLQHSDPEKKKPIENQSLKDGIKGHNDFSPLDKGQTVSEKGKGQGFNGVQGGSEMQNGLQNANQSKNPENLRNGLKGNYAETSINNGQSRSNQEPITNTKLDAMQPNMKTQLDGTPSGAEVKGAMKMTNENHDAAGNLNLRTQATELSLNDQVDTRTNRPSLNQNERLEADMKVNSPEINHRGEMATDMKINRTEQVIPTIASQSADVKFNASDRVAPNVANQTADVKFNSSGMSQKGEMTADMKVNSSTNASPITANATNPSVQKVLQQVERTSFRNPETATQSVIQQVQQGSFGTSEQKQRIVQEIAKSSTATPQQMQQNVQQVLTSARLPQETQNVVQRVLREAQNGTSQPSETIKTKVIQELEQASFGTKEPIRQAIIQDVQKAFSATPDQVQQNVKQVLQQAEKSGSVTPEQAQQTIKQVVEKSENVTSTRSSNEQKTGYFGSLFGSDLHAQTTEVKPKKPSRFDFIKEQ